MQQKSKREEIEKLREFLKDNGIELVFSSETENYIDHINDTVVISDSQPPKQIIYTILHEIGHYFLDIHFEEQNKTTTVIEEVLAWDRGYDIGQTLRIEIDDKEWRELMERCIGEYIEQ